ncbi:hypothetical protein P3G55_17330 [Leptospira sp. 96542]|nr:hypothetical protein [Leptospira sp. 96542]
MGTSTNAKNREILLWRSIARQPEYMAGAFRLNQDITLRTFKNQEAKFLHSERFDFILAMKALLKPVTDLDSERMEYLIFRIFEAYTRELKYTSDPETRFSMDVLFQFIEFLCVDHPKEDVGSFLQKETSLTKEEVDTILVCIKVFNKLGSYFRKSPNLKKTIENGEPILQSLAAHHPTIPWLALESMFYLLVAQNALASKYSCDSLLKGWMKEYGFDENQYVTVANYFPPGTTLHEFHGKYTSAIRSLNSGKSKDHTMDLLLLRSIGNYFSSLLVKVAHQMEGVQTA